MEGKYLLVEIQLLSRVDWDQIAVFTKKGNVNLNTMMPTHKLTTHRKKHFQVGNAENGQNPF